MLKKFFYIVCLFCISGTLAQDCPSLTNPLPNSVEVPVTTSISWEEVPGVTGYIISIGTTAGGGEIINEQPVGSDTTFTPPLGLPESTQIYVTITLFFFDRENIVCPSQWFTTTDVTSPPLCTQLISPEDGDENVNVGSNLLWAYAPLATGYRITIGTAPGSGNIVNDLDVGNELFYNPANNFPSETLIYVLIAPYNENGRAANCEEESFTTGDIGEPPGCTMLITPEDGEVNVELSPLIEWAVVPGALGYIVNIGRSPFVNDILDGVAFFTNSTFVINFEPNKTYFVRIIPFNDAGQAQNCPQESFSTILGCGPFVDPETGELVSLNPEINFPEQVGICLNDLPTRINSTDNADGYRWFRVAANGDEALISEESYVEISETGTYRYEAYNLYDQEGVIIECSSSQIFTVVSSEKALVEDFRVEEGFDLFNVTIIVSGIGDYEFALGDAGGPYSEENQFNDLEEGDYVIYIKDQNGCGIVEYPFRLKFPETGFPPYFSPNEDGINDRWQYRPPRSNALPITRIFIYDRYGRLLSAFDAGSEGWDGTYNGNALPSSSYWYVAYTSDGRIFKGFFTLARTRQRNR